MHWPHCWRRIVGTAAWMSASGAVRLIARIACSALASVISTGAASPAPALAMMMSTRP